MKITTDFSVLYNTKNFKNIFRYNLKVQQISKFKHKKLLKKITEPSFKNQKLFFKAKGNHMTYLTLYVRACETKATSDFTN